MAFIVFFSWTLVTAIPDCFLLHLGALDSSVQKRCNPRGEVGIL